jgi:hypothetical protein
MVAKIIMTMVAGWLQTPLCNHAKPLKSPAWLRHGCGSCGHGREIVARRHPRPVGDETALALQACVFDRLAEQARGIRNPPGNAIEAIFAVQPQNVCRGFKHRGDSIAFRRH